MTYPGVNLEDLDPDRRAVEERRREREEEFGAYVAVQDIPWGNVLAFVAGDPVPKSTVERLGWLDLGLVAKTGTKAAEAATPRAVPSPAAADAASTSSKPKSGGNS
jgi:hypothetical protein